MIRRPPIETKVNHERWLVSYSDFITLLFAFFVVMYSVSHVNEQKYRQLSSTLESAFSSGASSVEDISEEDKENPDAPVLAEVEALADDIKEALAGVVDDDRISISGNEQWVEIELSAGLLFQSGKADISDDARTLLAPVVEIMAPFDNAVAIAGHTDDIPIQNADFQNNWALSSARAVAVVNFLAYQGVKPERLSAVGYGEYRPVVSNVDDASRARNRRVVLKIAKNAVPPPKQSFDEYSSEATRDTTNTTDNAISEELGEALNDGSEASLDQGELSSADQIKVSDDNPSAELPDPGVNPVRLQGGGLLFSSDPDLPRSNPPVAIPPEEPITELEN
ncbi:MAG: OmpA family protein [Agarilytica sp.]